MGRQDRPFVLRCNHESVQHLAPLDDDRLDRLVGWGANVHMADADGSTVGFVVLFEPGSEYDSDNYRWFSERHERFVYLDRVVIDVPHRRAGHASALYDLVEPETVPMLLEVNLVPPNEASLAFHLARGYTAVGERSMADGAHVVSMLALGI